MKKVLIRLFGAVIVATFSLFLWVLLLTPEKTIHGEYTQPFKYWTSDKYFNDNFKQE